jgi:hypothetical protein
MGPDPLFTNRNEHLVALTFRHGVPTIFELPKLVAVGSLMSYGAPNAAALAAEAAATRIPIVFTKRLPAADRPMD